jgi:hypothetical protein
MLSVSAAGNVRDDGAPATGVQRLCRRRGIGADGLTVEGRMTGIHERCG